MKRLRIKWQRLVYDGQTCPRCNSTEQELEGAVSTLRKVLLPLRIDIVLEKAEISAEDFKKNPLQSNKIWLNDRPLEAIVGGLTGQSSCCDICGPADCRTVEVEGTIYEAIPADLVIKAGLIEASKLVGTGTDESCCESEAPAKPAVPPCDCGNGSSCC